MSEPNPKIENAIRHADTDMLAVAYALLQVSKAIREHVGTINLTDGLNNIAREIEKGTRRIARALRDPNGVDNEL